MFDSLGNTKSNSLVGQIAPGSGSQSTAVGPLFLDLDASLYNSGDSVTFTCETHVTGGVSAADYQTNHLVIT